MKIIKKLLTGLFILVSFSGFSQIDTIPESNSQPWFDNYNSRHFVSWDQQDTLATYLPGDTAHIVATDSIYIHKLLNSTGGGSAAGTDGQLQYNDNGSLAGTNITYPFSDALKFSNYLLEDNTNNGQFELGLNITGSTFSFRQESGGYDNTLSIGTASAVNYPTDYAIGIQANDSSFISIGTNNDNYSNEKDLRLGLLYDAGNNKAELNYRDSLPLNIEQGGNNFMEFYDDTMKVNQYAKFNAGTNLEGLNYWYKNTNDQLYYDNTVGVFSTSSMAFTSLANFYVKTNSDLPAHFESTTQGVATKISDGSSNIAEIGFWNDKFEIGLGSIANVNHFRMDNDTAYFDVYGKFNAGTNIEVGTPTLQEVTEQGNTTNLSVTAAGLNSTANLQVDGTGDSYFQGNVGIGITTPTTALDVDGIITTNSSLAIQSGYDEILMYRDGGQKWRLIGGSHWSVYDETNDVYRFHVGNDGDVGIGTYPSEKLDVNGRMKAKGVAPANYIHDGVSLTQNTWFDKFAPAVPNIGDMVKVSGIYIDTIGNQRIVSRVERTGSSEITVYSMIIGGSVASQTATDGNTNEFSQEASISF